MSSFKVAVIFPSRGLAFSQTCEELLENLEGYDYDIFFSHQQDIPDCFNKPLKSALKGLYTHFWLVEDDMILPKGVLKSLLKAKTSAICCDYPVTKEGKASVLRDPDGNAVYGGTGCLLVTREFLEMYPEQTFRTDIAWDIKHGDRFEVEPRQIKGDLYGLHDITFGLYAYSKGIPIRVSKIKCGQRKLTALGRAGDNNGEHQIETWTTLKPERLKLKPITNRNVLLNDGTLVYMDIKRAEELEKQDKLTILPLQHIEFIKNEVFEEIT